MFIHLITLCSEMMALTRYHIISQWSSSGPVYVLVSVLRVDGAI